MNSVIGNLPTVAVQNPTDKFFNDYLVSGLNVSPAVNDAVIGFFQNITGDAETGKALASSVMYTATSRGIDPMSIIDELRKLKTGKKTEIKTPVDADIFVMADSYQNIEAIKEDYDVGQLFYVENTNLFYILNENYRIAAAPEYKAEIVTNTTLENTVYNFFKVEYQYEENELNAYLTLFLNLNRVNTSLLGISNSLQTNKYVQRAILP